MKVKEIIELLEEQDPDDEVIIYHGTAEEGDIATDVIVEPTRKEDRKLYYKDDFLFTDNVVDMSRHKVVAIIS